MKKFTVLFLLISLTHILAANNPNKSALEISLYDNALFNIRVNGTSYNNPSRVYKIKDLNPGRHFVEVFKFEMVFNGREYVPGRPGVIFADYIRIPARVQIKGHINHRQRFVETSRIALRPAPANVPRPPGAVYPQRPHATVAMSPMAFYHLKQTLVAETFDSNRLKIAKQAIASSRLTSDQVRELMLVFSFESNRLSLAKYAYPYTVDPQNYFVVNSSFTFSGSKRDLDRYLTRNYS